MSTFCGGFGVVAHLGVERDAGKRSESNTAAAVHEAQGRELPYSPRR